MNSIVKNILMVIMMIKMNTKQHDEEDYIGYDYSGWRSLASCPGGGQQGDKDNDGEDYDEMMNVVLTCKLSRWGAWL